MYKCIHFAHSSSTVSVQWLNTILNPTWLGVSFNFAPQESVLRLLIASISILAPGSYIHNHNFDSVSLYVDNLPVDMWFLSHHLVYCAGLYFSHFHSESPDNSSARPKLSSWSVLQNLPSIILENNTILLVLWVHNHYVIFDSGLEPIKALGTYDAFGCCHVPTLPK